MGQGRKVARTIRETIRRSGETGWLGKRGKRAIFLDLEGGAVALF